MKTQMNVASMFSGANPIQMRPLQTASRSISTTTADAGSLSSHAPRDGGAPSVGAHAPPGGLDTGCHEVQHHRIYFHAPLAAPKATDTGRPSPVSVVATSRLRVAHHGGYAAVDLVTQSTHHHMVEESRIPQGHVVGNLAHCIFEVTRFVSVPVTLSKLVACTGADGHATGVDHPLFSKHMFPTVGDILSDLDDDHFDPTLIAVGEYSSTGTMRAALRALRNKHILANDAPDGCGGPEDCVVLLSAEVEHCTSNFPLPLGLRITGVRNKIATDAGCFADVVTVAGAVSAGEPLDVLRHSCSDAQYASYVGVSPERECKGATPDAHARDTFTPTTAIRLFVQHEVASANGAGDDPDTVYATHRMFGDAGVTYDPNDPSVVTTTKKGNQFLEQRLKSIRDKMPIHRAADMRVELLPAGTCTWAEAADALERTYPGDAVACSEFTVEVAVRLRFSLPNLSYALLERVNQKYCEMRVSSGKGKEREKGGGRK